jgi:anti-anti-sigma factor
MAAHMSIPRRRRFARGEPQSDDDALTVTVEIDRGQGWLHLQGELDVETAGVLRRMARELERMQPHTIVFDLRQLDFIDSAGISELLVARRRGERVGRRVLLATEPGSGPARVLAMTGIDAVMAQDPPGIG